MEESKKNYWVTYAQLLFLGYVGAHLFYLGRAKRGALYLCSLPFLFPAVYFWLKDLYLIYIGDLADGEGKKLPSYRTASRAGDFFLKGMQMK